MHYFSEQCRTHRFLRQITSVVICFLIVFVQCEAKADFRAETRDPQTSELYRFSSNQSDSKARPSFVQISTRIGEIFKFDYDNDGFWDVEIIDAPKYRITKSEFEGGIPLKIVVRTVDGLDSTEMTFWLADSSANYDLWRIQHIKNDIYFLSKSPDCASTDQSGNITDVTSGVTEAAVVSVANGDSYKPLADKSCAPDKAIEIKKSIARILMNKPELSKRHFGCLQKISPSYSDQITFIKNLDSRISSGLSSSSLFTCANELDDKKKNAQVGPDGKIKFRNAWINKISSESEARPVVFHELLHLSGVKKESEVEKIVRCCEADYDASKPDCQKTEKENETPKRPPTYGLRDNLPELNGPTRNAKSSAAKKVLSDAKASQSAISERGKSNNQSQKIDAVARPIPTEPRMLVAEGRKSSGVIKQSVQEAERIVKAAEPAKRLANAMSLPKAQAQEPQPRTQAATSRQQASGASERSDSSSITPTSVETKVTGMNANGSPKLQLPNGDTVQSFRAFAVVGVSKFESDSVGSSGSTKSNASFSAPTLSANSGSSHSVRSGGIAAAPSIVAGSGRQASATAEAHGGNTGGGSSSGGGGGSSASSGSSFGGSSGSSPRTRAAGRAPSSQGVQEAEPIASSTLQPRSHGIAELQRVRVEKTGDVMKIVTGAQAPRDLLKQTWFEDHLKNEQFRIQIIDKGQKYGSDRPRVLWNLPVLLKENQR